MCKMFYVIKQASRSWNVCFDVVVKEFDFIKMVDEPCIYKKVVGSMVVILVEYVDDILLMRKEFLMLRSINLRLSQRFSV